MGVVNVSIGYLEKNTGLKKEKIRESLENLGFPVEIQEGNFWVEITPDRPDNYLVQGLVRSINSFVKKKNRRYSSKKSKYEINVDKTVEQVRPYISACVVKGISLSEEEIEQLIDAQEKIHQTVGRKRKKLAIGVHNLDVIEFPLRYAAVRDYEFVPLESTERMNIEEILTRHPKGIGYAHLVEKGKYPMIYEEKTKRVVSFPPIINEERTKLKEGVKDIFVEITGTHKETVENMVSNFACSLVDLGGEVYEVRIGKEHHPKLGYEKKELDQEYVNRILGTSMKKGQIKESLERMGYFVKDMIEVPPYRGDIIDYIDIVEDVAIGHGYENLKPTTPGFFTSGNYSERTKQETAAREIMNGMGFLEIVTPILTSEEKVGEGALKVLNPCTREVSYIREDLFESMMSVFENNKMKGLPQKLYDLGRYYKNKKERRGIGFGTMDKRVDFNSMRSLLQTLMKETGREFTIKETDHGNYRKGRCGLVVEDKEIVGIIGEVSPELLKKRGIKFEIGFCQVSY